MKWIRENLLVANSGDICIYIYIYNIKRINIVKNKTIYKLHIKEPVKVFFVYKFENVSTDRMNEII